VKTEANNSAASADYRFVNADQAEDVVELISRVAGISAMAATLAVVFAIFL
jgi:hypothetical protein